MDKYSKFNPSRYHSRYSAEFKNHVCKEYLEGQGSKIELQRKYGIKGHDRVKVWLENYPYLEEKKSQSTLKKNPSQEPTRKQLEQQVKQLKKQLEDARLKEEAYRTMIEIAERELKIKIKKK
jgi:transposase-like protein